LLFILLSTKSQNVWTHPHICNHHVCFLIAGW